jgi:hypothetical protein
MNLRWTEEDTKIMNEYLNQFYHIGYPIETALTREVMMAPNSDDILDCLHAKIHHPKFHISINIVGRDH